MDATFISSHVDRRSMLSFGSATARDLPDERCPRAVAGKPHGSLCSLTWYLVDLGVSLDETCVVPTD